MCHRKQYVVPTRMHYDLFIIQSNTSKPEFVCSTNKECNAIEIMESLKENCLAGWTIKVRARPTVEHTIHSVRV